MNDPLIIREFQFTRDFRSIEWRATLWYNLLRAFMAGCTIAAMGLLLDPANASPANVLSFIFGMPIAYLAVLLPFTLLLSLFHWVPFVGLISMVIALGIALGDPLVCLLKRIAPAAVPVDQPTLFSLTPVFWLLRAEEFSIAR